MNFEIHPFAAPELHKLHPLLSASAGYEVSLQDEIDYFDPVNAKNWFYATSAGAAIGFIRAFTQGSWAQGELYLLPSFASRQELGHNLLKSFLKSATYDKNLRLRFELPFSEISLIPLLREAGFRDREEIFLYYEKTLSKQLTDKNPSIRLATSKDALATTAAFSNLHAVTEEEVANWIQGQKIYVTEKDGVITVAADISVAGSTAEVVRIATNAHFLRQGQAQHLLESLHELLAKDGIQKVYLKVDKTKQPAQSLYEKLGYKHLPEKDQIWLSKIF